MVTSRPAPMMMRMDDNSLAPFGVDGKASSDGVTALASILLLVLDGQEVDLEHRVMSLVSQEPDRG